MTACTTGVVGEHHLALGALNAAEDGLLRAVDPALVTDVAEPTTHTAAGLGQGLLGGDGVLDLLETGDRLLDSDFHFFIARGGLVIVQAHVGVL